MFKTLNTLSPLSLVFSLFFLLFLAIFNYTITLSSAIYTVSDLGGSGFMSNYATTFYAVGNALGVPLGRSFSDRVGFNKLLILCICLFAFFSWMCALSPNYFIFVSMRFLQGLVAGPFYTLMNRLSAVIYPNNLKNQDLDCVKVQGLADRKRLNISNIKSLTINQPQELSHQSKSDSSGCLGIIPLGKQPLFTSIMLTIFTVGPVLGASFGGWIAYDYDWRFLFYVNIPIALLLALFLGSKLQEISVPPLLKKFDGIGYIFYFIGILAVSFVLTTGQEFDWFRSPLINTFAAIGLLSLGFFFPWSYFHPEPIINFRFLKNISVFFGLFNLSVLFSLYFGTVILLALWLNLYVNYTPIWIAVLIGTMAIAGLLPTFLMMHRYGKMDCRIPLFVSLIFLSISSFHTALFDVDINFGRIAFSRILAGFGLALFLPPIFRLCFQSISKEKSLDMVILFQFVRALSSGIGSALYTILWQRRVIFYHERLDERLTLFSQPTQTYISQAERFHLKGKQIYAQLEVFLDRQATSLALDDCFYLMGWILIGLGFVIACSLFIKKEHFNPEI